jgi:hypothetical protein
MSTTNTTAAVQSRIADMDTDAIEALVEKLTNEIEADTKWINEAQVAVSKKRQALQVVRGEMRNREGGLRLEAAQKRAEERIAKAASAMGDCFCGCGIPHAAGKRFVQGHDARFWGLVNRIRNGKETMTEATAPMVRKAIEAGWNKGEYGTD